MVQNYFFQNVPLSKKLNLRNRLDTYSFLLTVSLTAVDQKSVINFTAVKDGLFAVLYSVYLFVTIFN